MLSRLKEIACLEMTSFALLFAFVEDVISGRYALSEDRRRDRRRSVFKFLKKILCARLPTKAG